MQLPGAAAVPAVDARRYELAQPAGRRIVAHGRARTCAPSAILTRQAFENAIRVNAAIGGSTNAIIHLLAIAGRARRRPVAWTTSTRSPPTCRLLVNLHAVRAVPHGGLLLRRRPAGGDARARGRLLHRDALTVTGRSVGREHRRRASAGTARSSATLDDAVPARRHRHRRAARQPRARTARCSSSPPPRRTCSGTAAGPLVFDSPEDYHAVVDDADLDVTPTTCWWSATPGPKGYPGMPEVGNVPLPAKLLGPGVTDMVRICDARMSGTGYGTVVLHVAPGGRRRRPARAGPHRRPDHARRPVA